MLEKFVRLFGSTKRGFLERTGTDLRFSSAYSKDIEREKRQNQWLNSRLSCAVMMIVSLGFVWMAADGICGLNAGGDQNIPMSWGIVGFAAIAESVYLCLRIIALHIKKQKGWNF